MSHSIIIRGNYDNDEAPVQAELQWEPGDGMPFDEQVEQFRHMLKLYMEARRVGGDPVT